MFDRLFEFIRWIGEALWPFVVIQPFEGAVQVRLGKFLRTLEPGFHWIAPLHIDDIWHDNVTPTTHHIAGLSTTTKDGRSIGFDAVVTYKIDKIEKALLEVTDVKDAVIDSCTGIIGTALSDATWEDVLHGRATDELTKRCRARGWRWGIEVISVQLAGVCLVKNIRLSGNTGSGALTVEHTI